MKKVPNSFGNIPKATNKMGATTTPIFNKKGNAPSKVDIKNKM